MNFAARYDVTMNKGIDECFKHGPVSIIRLVDAILRLFNKTNLGVALNKVSAISQQVDWISIILLIIKRIIEDGPFIQAIPTGAENPRVVDDILISHQPSCIGEQALVVCQSK